MMTLVFYSLRICPPEYGQLAETGLLTVIRATFYALTVATSLHKAVVPTVLERLGDLIPFGPRR
jgi:hypothetical protein